MQHSITVNTRSVTSVKTTLTLIFIASFGLSLIFTVGFAQGKGNVVHNAAHDTRHAAAFPCH
jgi:cobalt transporter subunit CbtB